MWTVCGSVITDENLAKFAESDNVRHIFGRTWWWSSKWNYANIFFTYHCVRNVSLYKKYLYLKPFPSNSRVKQHPQTNISTMILTCLQHLHHWHWQNQLLQQA